MVTDQIDALVPEGILLRSGRLLEADVLVTATGLKVQLFGGVRPRVDGQEGRRSTTSSSGRAR